MANPTGDTCMPIAVIGMGCRFPGDATSPENLWDILANGRSAWSEFPKDRINISGFYHPSGERQGSICFKGGHFLKDGVAAWDGCRSLAPFFSTTAHEAAAMDPQQRILLEVSYEAFENAGIPVETLPGTSTAVYCGSFVKDYEQICLRDPDDSPQYAATGNGIAIMSNRISWFYDLRGPSLTLDTGCSASLVGVHLACQSLRTGESTLALAMGAGLILTPATMLPMTALNFLSPDGKCFAFDERANGYGRGEGIGAVVLKPLEAALRDHDTIRAVIRGSGVNQDGKTPGITMPSKEAQALNIRAVYKAAGLGYDSTAYFEAHGTGTQAGDPTELGAISETFAETRNPKDPIYVGSVKTNIGHLEGCAGIAGLIKSVLMLERGSIPANLYFENVNPKIDLDAWRIKIPKTLTPWPHEGLRRISLNSFGFGGTNAHIILDDALHYLSIRGIEGNHCSVDLSPLSSPSPLDSGVVLSPRLVGSSSSWNFMPPSKISKLYVLSSHEEIGIERLSNLYSKYLERKDLRRTDEGKISEVCADLAYTLSCRRTQLPWKAFIVSSALEKLGCEILSKLSKPCRSSQTPNIAFVFSGQGAQWYAMGRELLQYQPFRNTLEEASLFLRSIGSEWSLMNEFTKDEDTSIISLPRISQPLCTALQIGLVDLLAAWGVVPYAVVGHSSGEIAAAYALGAISREGALKLAFHRGRLTSAVKFLAPTIQGRMMAVGLSQEAAEVFVSRLTKGTAVVACINSPESVTISGDEAAISELEELLFQEGVFARMLKVENAYHSHHMKVIERHYLSAIKDIETLGRHPGRQMFSTVTGRMLQHKELEPAYWTQNLVSPVQFTAAISALLQSKAMKPDVLLEIGPHSVLQGALTQIFDARGRPKSRPAYCSMLSRGKDAVSTSLEVAGHLWTLGSQINVEKINIRYGDGLLEDTSLTFLAPEPRNLVYLVTFPPTLGIADTKTYWHESHMGTAHRFRKWGRQDLIGAPSADSISFEPRWRGFLRVSENPWLLDHQVQNTIIYPAAGMMAMVFEAARQIQYGDCQVYAYELADMYIEKAMIIPDSSHGLETALNLKKSEDVTKQDDLQTSYFEFTIYSKLLDAGWIQNARGLLIIHYVPADDEVIDASEQKAKFQSAKSFCTEKISPRQLYETLQCIGMKYGPTFQNIVSVLKNDNVSCTRIRIPDTAEIMPAKYEYPHLIHPATLDAMFQTVFIAGSEPMVPSFLKKMLVSADFPSGADCELEGFSEAKRSGIRDAEGCITMFDASLNKPMLIVKDLHFTALSAPRNDLTESGFLPNHHHLCAELVWKEDVDPSTFTSSMNTLKSWDVLLIMPLSPSTETLSISSKITSTLLLMGSAARTTVLLEAHDQCSDKLCIALLEVEDSLVYDWTDAEFEAFRSLTSRSKGCLWITRGGQVDCTKPQSSPINALFRTLRSEDPQKLLYTLDLDPNSDITSDSEGAAIMCVFQKAFNTASPLEEMEYAKRDGKLLIPRIVLQTQLSSRIVRGDTQRDPVVLPFLQKGRPLQLKVDMLDSLDSLCFNDDADASENLHAEDIEIKVEAVGVDRHDVETAMGRTSNSAIGSDVAGIVTRVGSAVSQFKPTDRVASIVPGAFRTLVRSQEALVQRLPDDMTFEIAASLPSDAVKAYYSLMTVGRLQQGESVFIHSGATGLGQAAIRLAKHIGVDIYTTAHSLDERKTLCDVYGIYTDHIFDFACFGNQLRRLTSGRGVDLVLNTLGRKYLTHSWNCVSEWRFVQVANWENKNAAMPKNIASRLNVSYSTVDLDHLIQHNKPLVSRLFASCWELDHMNTFENSEPLKVHPLSELSLAFRNATEQTHGKVVVKVNETDLVPILPYEAHSPRLDPDASYVLAGGLGGLGRSIAGLLIKNGARHLVFLSRSGAVSEQQVKFLKDLKLKGVETRAYACDICDRTQLGSTIHRCLEEMPRIKGVIQGAAVIRDAIFENMTYEDWVAATRPKMQGSWNLHELLPKDLDFFVFLSSSAGVIGARGQANYNAGNGFQDTLAQHRRSKGLAAVSLDLGPVLGAGMVAEDEATLELLRASGFISIREKDFHTLVSTAMTGYAEDNYRTPAQVIVGTGTGGLVKQNQVHDPYWHREARFSIMREIDLVPDSQDGKSASVQEFLSSATSLSQASEIILEGLVVLLSRSMNMLPADLDTRKPANSYGVDSLVAVGMRNWIFRETGVDVSIFEILSELNIKDMAEGIAKKCRFCSIVIEEEEDED
ncbi:related to polyketide synthase [Phialocephala subalpina]|uniref:Related to polyketide synthase n=1 Tax=Phialocephala subalpina TaxID=576137 RepID=A0A1L7WQG9_9HELO|nr:related to polyketide synthase [Phialocephala subalpina]